MGSCSSLSTIGSPNFKPTSIRLITMKLAERLLPRWYFLEYSKNFTPSPPLSPVDRLSKLVPTVRLITVKHAMRLHLFFHHWCLLEFSKNLKYSPSLSNWTRPLKLFPLYFKPNYIRLITMKLALRLLLVLPH